MLLHNMLAPSSNQEHPLKAIGREIPQWASGCPPGMDIEVHTSIDFYPDSWLTSWPSAQGFRKDQKEASITKRHMGKGQVYILIGMDPGYEVLVSHVNA